LLRWQVGARWYAVALLTAPFLAMVILLALSLLSPKFLPGIFASDDKASLLLLGITGGLGAGIFEELGWTGFAIPELRRRYGVFTTGLSVGFLWGAWHLLVYFWGSGDSSGALSLAILLPALLSPIVVLPAYRVLMVWVYDHTGSLLVAILMHVSLTASTLIIQPLATSGMPGLTYSLVLAATLWIFVATVQRLQTLPRQERRVLPGQG
jgi:membrane protease YdiL (CAAX protease family)